jgi:hypothetical protein
MSYQPDLFNQEEQQDDAVHFYAEWHGVRYSFGTVNQKPERGVRADNPTLDDLRMRSIPFGRMMLEVEFQPVLYRERGDDADAPMREHLYLRGRRIPSSDYIILSDEKLKEIEES